MFRTALALASSLALACAGTPDPVVTDPPRDDAYPPAIVGTPVMSEGLRMNGIVYVAQGVGPHGTVILLHGFPGEERNLDLAQAIRRAGWNVLFYHYRGAWGSQGGFSFGNALQDVAAGVAFVGSRDFAERFRGDPRRIALVGHSMGGFMALTAGSELAEVGCIASLAGANLGLQAALDDAAAEQTARRLQGWSAPLAGTSGRALVAEVRRSADRFDTLRRAPALAKTRVLLVAGARDQVTPVDVHHTPLAQALRDAGAASLTTQVLDADHAFSSQRIALARTVVGWLETECGG